MTTRDLGADGFPGTGGWVEGIIRAFTASEENHLGPGRNTEPAFDTPLVGFSYGDDPLYRLFKEEIGDFYWTPQEIFNRTFPDSAAAPADLTVVAWILPQTKPTRVDNRREKSHPSERWARARKFGEEFNAKLREHTVQALMQAGYLAVAPQSSSYFSRAVSERYGFASTWSERHAAYVSGLGTFGLCDGLITPVGKAARIGSLVARISIPPTSRPYSDHHEYCLFFSEGTCEKCIQRCPAGAVTASGHDKEKCRDQLRSVADGYVQSHYHFSAYACGLCQTGVPCEFGIPRRKGKKGQGAALQSGIRKTKV